MGATFATAATGFGSTIVDNIFGLVNNRETNQANKDINAAALQQQRDLTAQSQDWQSKENQISREWNSPVTQKLLYEQAGINPYLSESGQISAGGATPQGAASVAAAPQIAMQPARLNLKDLGNYLLSARSVDAKADADKADAFSRFIDAIPTLSRYLDDNAVERLIQNHLPEFLGSSFKDSLEYQLLVGSIKHQGLVNSQEDIAAKVAEKYGEDTAYRKLLNLEQEATESVVRCGLYNTLAKVNDSIVNKNVKELKVMDAQIDELIARAWNDFQQGSYAKSLGLTQNELREWWKNNAMLQYLDQYYDTVSKGADFEENEMVRKYKGTKAAKIQQQYGYGLENNAATKTLDYLGNRLNKVVPSTPVPARSKYNTMRRKRTTTTYNGKLEEEYFAPMD